LQFDAILAHPATTTKFIPLIISAIKALASQLTDIATTVANFAQSFTTKELIATNGTFESVATKQLCAIKSDGNQVPHRRPTRRPVEPNRRRRYPNIRALFPIQYP
jgi:hypothetical protein